MILDILLLVIAVLLVTVVLMQNRGAGLGASFGGQGGISQTRRGGEKVLHVITITLSIAFLLTAFANTIY
ncbi:MAG: preprotein translocase subunit SecG [Candidatus Buchananbacteria bacterium RIFCSPHIGHO2_01_FULL_47_11b]|uniref:Protein-export membrane protein SecG n=1 Tax=Candidatus Buchananbacteria bacterium RIFCSPHIGHO2_01_FULL_47_11b TaxID=1797537 RepID=A0A1G1Y561_9BACT|nr:MAG: preprotein translocase subunit SecG [Candidatus Buchananbacteria bacterium RIFCSPHIGHO2_01_FULL_47_11b]